MNSNDSTTLGCVSPETARELTRAGIALDSRLVRARILTDDEREDMLGMPRELSNTIADARGDVFGVAPWQRPWRPEFRAKRSATSDVVDLDDERRRRRPVDPLEKARQCCEAARDLLQFGRISPETARELTRAGIALDSSLVNDDGTS